MQGDLPQDWNAELLRLSPTDGPMATRIASGKMLEDLGMRLPELMGGPPTSRRARRRILQEPEIDMAGRNMYFGIREHAMGAMLNGMVLHHGLIAYGATFLIFSDYMRPPMRSAAMNGLPVIYIFTHDSIAMAEDGPLTSTLSSRRGYAPYSAGYFYDQLMRTKQSPHGKSQLHGETDPTRWY